MPSYPKAKSFSDKRLGTAGSRSFAIHDGGKVNRSADEMRFQFAGEGQASLLSRPHKAALATIDKEGFPRIAAMGFATAAA
jgi:hypothetical protein